MKILLVDDEELQLIRLEKTVKKVVGENEEFFCYSNPVLALKDNKDTAFDIAFLDIDMPIINGLVLAKSLKKINPVINIIFVTAYDHYALEAYKIHASGYISKPVSEQKVKVELEGLRYPVENNTSKGLYVKCFGNFEVFYDGLPLKFSYQKSKEVFAYLIDREGSSANINELNAVMWEEDHKSYLRNLIADIQKTLKECHCEDIFIKKHNECSIDVSKVNCDAYEYRKNNPNAIRMYRGEYMIQYSWAIFKDEVEEI